MKSNNRNKLMITILLVGAISMFVAIPPGNVPASAQQAADTPEPRETEQLPPTQVSLPEEKFVSDPELQLLQNFSEAKSIPAEHLQINYIEDWNLPLTGVEFTYAKVFDTTTGIDYTVGLDRNGAIVDPEALQAAERAAASTAFGKLHPSLVQHLAGSEAQGNVRVSIWLDMGGRDASIPRINPSEAASMSAEALRLYKAEGLARAAQIHREVEKPLLDFLPTVGGKLISAADNAPIVFVEIPVQAIQRITDLPYVEVIDLLVEGGPEEEGGGEKQAGGPELATARPASKANIVEARGFDGAGIVAAVIEGDSIEFANPYLADGTCGPNVGCPTIDEHATTVGGIMASTHSTSRGTAPGIGTNLLSGNGGGWNLPNHQAATTWALGQGATILNNSYLIESDGLMHNSDRWMDYIVRNVAVLEVKSAGNRGEGDAHVTSPGLGYNVLTVGAFEDKNTITWDDDVMAEISSWDEPAGREKPEVSAVGCGDWVSGTGGVPGIISTGMSSPWIYDQGCGTSYSAPIVAGGAALLIDRNPSLAVWPEAIKAIFIATALHNIEGASVKSEVDGAGGVDLAAADQVAANYWWHAQGVSGTSFDASDYLTVETLTLYAGEPVRAALAYDSNPAADYSTDPLEGDLDLYLKNPSGIIVASAAGVDSWEVLSHTPTVTGTYTLVVENHAHSLADTEFTYIGTAIWPGHYVLSPNVSQTRDMPSGSYNKDSGDEYRFTRGSFWNAVGVRFGPATDYDVYLFDKSVYGDPADHILREDSTLGTGTLDIVVVDGNHAPSGNYYTTVSAYSGTGNYTTQHATSTGDLYTGTYGPYSASSDNVLRVWDIPFGAGETKYVCVSQVSGSADLGVLLFDSDVATSSTWYQGRSQAVAGSDNWRAGSSEYLSYTSPDGDWKGLVVYNKGGSSTYNVIVSSTPQSGCESWSGGISVTSNKNVVAVGRPHIGSEVASYGGFSNGSLTAYVPMLFKGAFGGSYNSAFYVQNVHTSNTANVTIKYYDSSGAMNCIKNDTIASLASKGYWLPSATCDSGSLPAGWVGGVVVTSSQPIVTVGRPHVGAEVMTYNGFSLGSLTSYIPMLFKGSFGGSYNSAFYIQNVHSTNTAAITIRYYDSSGVLNCTKADTVAPLASKGYWVPGATCDSGSLPAGWVGGVVVTSSQPIVGVGRPHIGTQVTTYNGFMGGSLNAYVPMLFKGAYGGSYNAAFYVQNVHTSNTATVTIKYYDSAGNLSCTKADTIAPLASKGYWVPSATCDSGSLPAGWLGGVVVTSNQPIVAVGRPHIGAQVTTYNGFTGGSLNTYLPMLFKNAFGGTYNAAFYIQNTEASAAAVTVNFYDSNGNLSCVRNDTIPALSTLGYWLPSVACNP